MMEWVSRAEGSCMGLYHVLLIVVYVMAMKSESFIAEGSCFNQNIELRTGQGTCDCN